ncbi:MAG: hypothetical protein ACRD2D_01800 [Terriglobales bacterium]
MATYLRALWKNDNGQDMAEYAVLLGVIAAAVVAVVLLLSSQITSMINATITAM